MDETYYLFAIFIFLLLVALVFIYVRLTKPRKNEDTAISEKERRLFLLYQNLDEMMSSIESYVEEAKSEIAAEREKMVNLLQQAERLGRGLDTVETIETEQEETPKVQAALDVERPNKHEKVAALSRKGLNIEQIAQELEISCGEVSLILGISKK